ncbi:Platelet-activating factor acetylhydrolase, partial [Trichoplax sp. H2]
MYWFGYKTALPKPTGPYNVGTAEIMSGRGEQSTLVRLYYPTQPSQELRNRCHTSSWLPEPINNYTKGIIDFAEMPLRFFTGWMLRNTVIPTYQNAPLIQPKDYEETPQLDLQRLRVLICSHGLGGNRAILSVLCCELASYGYVAASLDHRDLSASHTYYYPEKEGTEIAEKAKVINVPFKRCPIDDFETRNKQVNIRAQEVSNVIDLLEKLNAGAPITNLIDSSDFKLEQFKAPVFGHSFGGGTTIAALAKDARLQCGVCLDAWLFPLGEEVYENINKPILFINSFAFQWPKNIKRIQRILSGHNGDFYMFQITQL